MLVIYLSKTSALDLDRLWSLLRMAWFKSSMFPLISRLFSICFESELGSFKVRVIVAMTGFSTLGFSGWGLAGSWMFSTGLSRWLWGFLRPCLGERAATAVDTYSVSSFLAGATEECIVIQLSLCCGFREGVEGSIYPPSVPSPPWTKGGVTAPCGFSSLIKTHPSSRLWKLSEGVRLNPDRLEL